MFLNYESLKIINENGEVQTDRLLSCDKKHTHDICIFAIISVEYVEY